MSPGLCKCEVRIVSIVSGSMSCNPHNKGRMSAKLRVFKHIMHALRSIHAECTRVCTQARHGAREESNTRTNSHDMQHVLCNCILAFFAQQKHAQQGSHTRILHPLENMLSTSCKHACWRDSLALRCRATRKSMWKYWFTVSVSKVLLAPRATAKPSPVPANQVVN